MVLNILEVLFSTGFTVCSAIFSYNGDFDGQPILSVHIQSQLYRGRPFNVLQNEMCYLQQKGAGAAFPARKMGLIMGR